MSINRKSIRETTGDERNVAQSFKQNIFFDAGAVTTVPFAFEVPQYTTIGGTKDYYGQNPLAIFTNLVKPFIRFDFSENTSSFGPEVFIKHDIYRVRWDAFNGSNQNPKIKSNEDFKKAKIKTEVIEEFDESSGEVRRRTITTRISEEENLVKLERDTVQRSESVKSSSNISESEITSDNVQSARDKEIEALKKENSISKANSAKNTTPDAQIQGELMGAVQDQLLEPIFSITVATTDITTNIYDLVLDQFTKNYGEYKTELFEDRGQYIIDTNFVFNRNVTPGLKDLKIVQETPDGGSQIIDDVYKNKIQTETHSNIETVAEGKYSGMAFFGGEYFSYFQVPNKPIFEYPTPTGQIDTFTPEIFWTNGEDADEYMVQVNYNTGDTGFTGTVFTYIVPKSDDFKEEALSKTKDSVSEFTTTKAIRKYQLSLKSNKCLLYRVGNVKKISNLFGVRQSVVTFSDPLSLCTQVEPIQTFVFTENNSPYIGEIGGLRVPPSLNAESPLEEYVLSGTVSGSTVVNATMQLVYPNSSYVTQPTDAVGGFSFSGLEAGTYTLNTTYRGYAMDSRQIVINSDTNLNFCIKILWDNDYDTWGSKENDIIKY